MQHLAPNPKNDSGTADSTQNSSETVAPDDMTHFRWDLLWTIAGGADYGLGIKRTVEDYYGTTVNHGRLYPNLDWLVEQGLVEKAKLDNRTHEYRLTSDGLDVLDGRFGWLAAMVGGAGGEGGADDE